MSVKNENENKLPVLEIEKVANIKYEKPEDFKNSISYSAYKRAFEITRDIVNDNQKYKDSISKKNSGTVIRNAEQICNIIFFTGDRGTGKTSIMLSYMEFLKDYYRNYSKGKNISPLEISFDGRDFMFTGLEYFDASSLDSKESILGSVLANMLKKWETEERRSFGNHGILREEDYGYKKRKIQSRFNEVFKYLKNLRSKKDIIDEDSDMFMEILEDMSMTWNLKQAFQQLVKEYLDIMEYPGTEGVVNSANHFLVISIDDLDLNIKNGFSLLDEVRTYLMIPNIIVLLSANYDQLEKVCINHYASEFKDTKDKLDVPNHIKRLSREYVEKIMPASRQVVLYSGKKWDFFQERKLIFRYSYNAAKENEVIKVEEGKFKGTIEELIANNMKNYFCVNLFKDGKILYYLTPDTLRELVSWINQIGGLRKIDENLDIKLQVYEDNLKWFWNEHFSWIIKKYLKFEEQDIFKAIDALEPLSQIRLFKRKLSKKYSTRSSRSLLQILGRLNQRSAAEQEFSSLYLLYFTVKVSEIMKLVEWSSDMEREKNLKILMQYYSNGVWGTWERDMTKTFLDARTTKREQNFNKIGYIEFSQENERLGVELKGSYDEKDGSDVERFIAENNEILINYQYMLLFYRLNIESDQREQRIWTIGKDKKNENIKIKLKKNISGLFCLSNIVINLLEGARLVERFVKDLSLELSEKQKINQKSAEDIATSVSILKLSGGIGKYKGKSLLPLDNLEYLINLGIELQDHAEGGITVQLGRDTIIQEVNVFFNLVKQNLSHYYTQYEERFCECPLIDKILNNDEGFMNMLATSILSDGSVYKAEEDDEEWSN